ncbi:MAG TPA: hypothetical protein VGA37_09075 [Gemmatimonadales bacterium]
MSLSADDLALLRRASSGESEIEEVAEWWARTESLHSVAAPGDLGRFFQDMDSALAEKGLGNVSVADAAAPRPIGRTTEDGFFLQVWTDLDLAREYGAANGILAPDAVFMTSPLKPVPLAWNALVGGHAGVIVDDGSDHRMVLRRNALARLYALSTRDAFAQREQICGIGVNGRILMENVNDGEMLRTYVYESEELARIGCPALDKRFEGNIRYSMAPSQEVLRFCLEQGITHLIVNEATPVWYWYERADIEVMLAGAPPERPRGADIDPALQPKGPARALWIPRALKAVAPAPTPPPGRNPAASAAALKALRQSFDRQQIKSWEMADQLCYDIDWFVPVIDGEDGLPWPKLFPHPNRSEQTVALGFTSIGMARDGLTALGQLGSHEHLSGLEALRWIWAMPSRVDEVGLDFIRGKGEPMLIIRPLLVLAAIYPHFETLDDFDEIQDVGLAQLGHLKGARGLKAEAVEALVKHWRRLIATAGSGGAAPTAVAHHDGRFLPVFTSEMTFMRYESLDRAFADLPAPAGNDAPFGAWLRASRDCDGVVIDPGAAAPLTLDHTALLMLDLWCRLERQPRGRDLTEEVARLMTDRVLDGRAAARLVADWPQWVIGLQEGAASLTPLKDPDADTLLLFSSPDRMEMFLLAQRNQGRLTQEFRTVPAYHQWGRSLFHQAADHFADGIAIDPAPLAEPVLRLGPDLVRHALERVDEQLKPRLPAFAGP